MSTAFKHQEQVLARSIDLASHAFFMEPGTGKTFCSIETHDYHFTNQNIDSVIVICPKSIMYTWVDQLALHSTTDYEVIMWKGMHKKEDLEEFNRKIKTTKLLYIIANTDAFISKNFPAAITHFVKHRKGTFLTVDESTSFKSMKAERTKACIRLSKICKYRRILSGTPITNSPMDLYAQAEILGKNMLGYSSFFTFKTRFCVLQRQTFGSRSFDVVKGYRDMDTLSSIVSKFASVVKLEDCIDMPERVFSKVIIEMPPKQRELYEELRTKAVAYIDEHEVTVVNALSMMTRLLQIVSGQLKLGDGSYADIENNRLETLKDIFDECEGKVIIWSSYVQSSKNIVKYLEGHVLHLSSDMDIEQRQAILDEFNEGTIKGIVLNPQSAAHGLNLNIAKTSIYYNNTYSLEHRLQSLARNYRIGQDSRTRVIDLVAKDTIEEKILISLNNMQDVAEKVVGREAVRSWFT